MTYTKQMTTNSYGRLKTPPIHPDARTQLAQEIRTEITDDLISSLPIEDKDFMYEQRKNNQHKERLLGAYLNLIREYDFLPKRILLEGFTDAVKHIYSANEEQEKQKEFEKIICDKAENMVTKLQEEN